MSLRQSFGVVGLLAIFLNAAAFLAAGEKKTSTVPIREWLLLGPVVQPSPVFGPEKVKADACEAALTWEGLPPIRRLPASGDPVRWSTGEDVRWRTLAVAGEDRVILEPPAGKGEGQQAVAWLATSLESEGYTEVSLNLALEHPHLVLLDGEKADAAKSGDAQKLALEPGSHLLVVKTVFDPSKEAAWTLQPSLEGELIGQVRSSTTRLRDLGILDVLDAAHVTSFSLSPDGKEVLLSLSRVIAGGSESQRWLEHRATDDGRLVRSWRGTPAPSQVRWAPTGRRFAYVTRDTEKKTGSLWLADLDDGSTQAVLRGVEEWGSYRWSPAGDAIVFSTVHEPEKNERGIKRMRGLLDRMADHRETASLHLVTVPDGVSRRLTEGPPSATAADFSPDGQRLLVTREIEDLSQRPYTRTELWELDLRTGGAEKLRDFRWLRRVEYGPDGRRLLVLGGVSTFGDAGFNLPEGTTPNDFDGQLFIWNPKSDEVDAITRDFNPAVSDMCWSPFDGGIYLVAADGDLKSLFRYDETTGEFTAIATGIESVDSFETARAASTMVVAGTSAWQPQRLVVLDGFADEVRPLLEPASDRFRSIRRGEVRTWDFTTASGRVVPGRIYLPTDFSDGRSYPAIVNFYAGTSPIERSFGGRYPAEWWAANGYVVYVPNPVGAYGRGQAASAVHVNDWGEESGREIIAATEAFLQAHPFVDPERVGCIGASYGGFETMSLLTRTEIFAAAVAHAGISALSSYWGEGYWGYSYGAVANAGSFPWNRLDIFVDRSPLFHADRVKTPLLLTHGDEDTNVPRGESDQFYAALELLGAEVEYLRVEGLGHWIMEHDKRALWSKSIVAWFDRWLKDEPGWWEALYPEP